MNINNIERYIDLFCVMLKSDKLKCTDVRQDILRVFFSNEHVSVGKILKDVKTSKQSVYTTLKLLLSYSIISKQNYEGVSFYELTRGVDHFHLLCSKCHKYIEFSDKEIVSLVADLAKKSHFYAKKFNITIYGLCRECNIDNQ